MHLQTNRQGKSLLTSDGKIDKDAVGRSVVAGKVYIMFGMVLYYTLTVVCPLTLAYLVGTSYIVPLLMPAIEDGTDARITNAIVICNTAIAINE